MKNNIMKDIKTAAGIFKDMRKARKEGAEIKIHKSVQRPLLNAGPGFYDTVEGCTLSNCSQEIRTAAQKAFRELPCEEKRRLLNAPEDGEFIERLHFWEGLLQPVLLPGQFRTARAALIRWYIHIKRMRKVLGVQA